MNVVDLDRVAAEARDVRVGRALLTVVVGVFWAVGWAAGMVVTGITFAAAAAKVGWQDARRGPAGARGR
jgi:hypothetical protein